MAVELAKVALWLHTFTVGAPLSFLDHHLRCGNSLFGFWVREAMDRLTKWGGQLLINEPMQKAMAQALAMQKLERVNDIDIAEVHHSKTLFDGIEQETRPLNSFIKILYALDWLKLDKEDQSSVRAWLDGQYGDPFEIARGRLTLGPADVGDGHPQAKDVLDQLSNGVRVLAQRFAGILSRARELIRSEKFQNWQVAFPGVWTRWESAELHGGFDVILGNPPYVRQELIKAYKPQLKRAFPESYDGSADLYVYFYDQGLRLLKPGGRLSYVVTNKWMRAGYAEGLRQLFADKAWIEFVADFGHAKKFFPDADVFPSVIVVRKPSGEDAPEDTQVCVIPRDDVPEKALDEAVSKATYPLPRAHFTKVSWVLEPPVVASLMRKIRGSGIPLAEFAGAKPYRGILTGLNEAFLINSATRDSIIARDPASRALIQPYLRGQDIRRWSSPETGLYMILLKSSADHPWPWAKANDENEAESIFRQNYPGLHAHLKAFESFTDARGRRRGLRIREDKGRWWWELRPCAYYDLFTQPRIVYQAIQFHPRYSFETELRYGNNKTFMLATRNLALLAALNSPLCWWYSWRHFIHLKDEALSNDQVKMAEIPIPPSLSDNEALADGVKRILELKRNIDARNAAILDWLHHEIGPEATAAASAIARASTPDQFVAAVRSSLPRNQRLSASQIAALKREYTEFLEPAVELRSCLQSAECSVADMVNEAYGLTPEEVDLMWRTAPPRMPFTPAGLPSAGEGIDVEDADTDE